MKIRKGDQVLIILGKDRGRKSKVIESLPKERRIVVEGINLRKKHVRPKKSGEKGQVVEMPASINVSSVKFICSKCKKATRIGFRIKGGKKYRVCKKCKEEI